MIGRRARIGAVAVALASSATAQVTERVSVDSSGIQGNGHSDRPAVSGDGRFVAFISWATNLVPGDTNFVADVFVRDRQSGTTERVSVDSSGIEANDESSEYAPRMSLDGRYVTFTSRASNLVAGDVPFTEEVFLRDRQLGTTVRVSVDSSGVPGNRSSFDSMISADGRFVTFISMATNLVPGGTSGAQEVFVRDLQNGTTEIVSVSSSGSQGNGGSEAPRISADGRFVAFQSYATTLAPGDPDPWLDIFVRDRQSGTTEQLTVSPPGAPAHSLGASISGSGRHVAFFSYASHLVSGDTNGQVDIFVRDRQSGTTELASISSSATQSDYGNSYPSISGDGRFVAFWTAATNLVPGDTNGANDACVRDRLSGTTVRASVDSNGSQANAPAFWPAISFDGRVVAFADYATNLVPMDSNGVQDVFVRDRLDETDFASLCDAGFGAVIPCPCANPPGQPGRGCDNSSATGGARLMASGSASLSSDSLVFTTNGEKPTALSIVTQWSGGNPTGEPFGMGVRCTSGTFERLYTKSAAGGSITAPDFGAGDPQVSVRSAALGDTILAGRSRWYVVTYRDPIVVGGCPSASTFNATQTGRVVWSL